MKGVVARIFEKEFANGMAYSFTLRGDRTFYRSGNKKPTFSEGDSIQFDVEMKGANAYAKGVSQWKSEDVVQGRTAAAVAIPRTADDFWRRKETRDIETQKRIELQSCRNSAIELVKLLQSLEAVKLPAKQADKVPVVEELVKHYTKYFIDENAGKDAAIEAVNEAAVEITQDDNKKDNNDDDTDWN
ncbi:MAG: hypothetical protein KGL39_08845 [Patescibacteria group bacterium]|nr:hypothetical protein [Patescibacteria group bacterium]